MNEAGLGPESALVLGQILAQKSQTSETNESTSFAHLDLGKNNLGNSGLANLPIGVIRYASFVSLDIGSNDIAIEGASLLFKTLK